MAGEEPAEFDVIDVEVHQKSLRNIKAVDVVSVGLRGPELDEWRAHIRVAFLIERVEEG